MLEFQVDATELQPPFRPHRPEAQDTALSRLRHGFESRWGRHFDFACGSRLRALGFRRAITMTVGARRLQPSGSEERSSSTDARCLRSLTRGTIWQPASRSYAAGLILPRSSRPSATAGRIGFPDDRGELLPQCGNSIPHDVPDQLEVDSEVVVNQSVTHAGHPNSRASMSSSRPTAIWRIGKRGQLGSSALSGAPEHDSHSELPTPIRCGHRIPPISLKATRRLLDGAGVVHRGRIATPPP